MVGPHEEGSHYALNSQPIVKYLGQFFLVILGIGDEVGWDSHVQVVCYLVLMQFAKDIEVSHRDT